MKYNKAQNIGEYILSFPKELQVMLNQVREIVRKAAPKAEETISYQMPAFRQNNILVYFAAHKNHIGFYPTASGIQAFQREIAGFKTSKGAIQFPLDQKIPTALIIKIVKFRVQEDLLKAKTKEHKK
jgi:uncharacterized protein YdhG (YjbR/CyaY superfamily)